MISYDQLPQQINDPLNMVVKHLSIQNKQPKCSKDAKLFVLNLDMTNDLLLSVSLVDNKLHHAMINVCDNAVERNELE